MHVDGNTEWDDLMSEHSYDRTEAYKQSKLAKGALPLLYAATDPEVKPGDHYGPEYDTKGYPVEVRAGEAAYDETDAKRL